MPNRYPNRAFGETFEEFLDPSGGHSRIPAQSWDPRAKVVPGRHDLVGKLDMRIECVKRRRSWGPTFHLDFFRIRAQLWIATGAKFYYLAFTHTREEVHEKS